MKLTQRTSKDTGLAVGDLVHVVTDPAGSPASWKTSLRGLINALLPMFDTANIFVGKDAGFGDPAVASYAVKIGELAGSSTSSSGYAPVHIGFGAAKGISASGHGVVIGLNAALENADGWQCVLIGAEAGYNGSSSISTGVGYKALYGSAGSNVVGLGYFAGRLNDADNCVFIGEQAGENNVTDGRFEIRAKSANTVPLITGNFITNKVALPNAGDYSPATPGDWSGTPPTTVAEALNRIAAAISPVP